MKFFERQLPRLLAVALLAALYLPARLPSVSGRERAALASRFRFDVSTLPTVSGPELRSVRPVHPSLRHIAAWISSVGAGVALHDLDGDGLPNDLCYVDVRTDQVIVAPAPGTGNRYQPFVLDAGPLFSRTTMAPMGCLPGDMNEDGRADLLVYYWGRTPLAFVHGSSGMNAAAYHAIEVVPGGPRWFSNAATFADFDGDGHPDLAVGNYFEDGAHILDADGTGSEHMGHSFSRAFNAGTEHILRWRAAGASGFQFEEQRDAIPAEAARGWTLAVGAADLDGDLLPELYIANDFGPDRLLHNTSSLGRIHFDLVEGRRTLATPASKVLGRDSFKGMGVDFGDVNGDGVPDIFVSNIAAPFALEEANFLWISTGDVAAKMRRGIAPYVDRGEFLGVSRSGWGWDSRLADFDNDGTLEALQAVGFIRGAVNRWPELHEIAMANDELLSNPEIWHHFVPGDDLCGHSHNPFYVRASDGRYYDVAPEIGIGDEHVSRGIAIADVDGDGRLDYAVANQWQDSKFYRNRSPHSGAFLGLRIRRANVPVIGAVATVSLPDGRRLVSQSDGGSGHSGKRSPDIHFGLGAVPQGALLPVEIRWRDAAGIHSRNYNLAPGWTTIDIGGQA